MVRRSLLKLFVRFSSLFGIPEIQTRLDAQTRIIDELARHRDDLFQRSDSINYRLEAVAHHWERRLIDTGNQFSVVSKDLEHTLGRIQDLSAHISVVSKDISVVSKDLEHTLGRIQDLSAHTENRLTSLNQALVEYIDAKEGLINATLEATRAATDRDLTAMRLSLDAMRRNVSTGPTAMTSSEHVDPKASDMILSDELYVALENAFRGSQDIVAQRQANYLDLLPNSISSETPLLDLGCGRGEWLDVLVGRGIPAKGVDSNSVCISECLEKGHDAHQADLLTYLGCCEDASIGCVTMFQVLEHLPFAVLVEALREIRRVLIPGGLFIGEVPNAKNLRVSAGTFWIDPTHQRPLYPELLEFLAKEVGFARASGMYVNDLSPSFDFSGVPENIHEILKRLLEAVDTAGDYTLLATA